MLSLQNLHCYVIILLDRSCERADSGIKGRTDGVFNIRIADLVVRIDNRYGFLRQFCEAYIVADELDSAFSVSAPDDEIRDALQTLYDQDEAAVPGDPLYVHQMGYCEAQCIHRRICQEMIRYDAVMLHAATIAYDGEAYAFSADSGTGKSTHIRLWMEQFGARVQVVNGDKPMLRLIDGVIYAFGTPWCGREGMNTNMRAPLCALCFLERSGENSITPIAPVEVYRRIFDQLQWTFDAHDEAIMDRFYSLVERIVGSVRSFVLRCNMKPEAAHVALKGIRGMLIDLE